MARNRLHRSQDPLIDDIAGPQLCLYHPPTRRLRAGFIVIGHVSPRCDQPVQPRESTTAQERIYDGGSHNVSPCDCRVAGREPGRIKNNSPDLSHKIRAFRFARHPFQPGGFRIPRDAEQYSNTDRINSSNPSDAWIWPTHTISPSRAPRSVGLAPARASVACRPLSRSSLLLSPAQNVTLR